MSNEADNNKKELIPLNERNFARVIGWISIIDSKAKFIFSVIIVVLGYSVARIEPLIKTCTTLWEKKAISPALILVFFMLAAFVCLIISFVYLLFIIYPKRKPYTGKASHFFYESIAQMSASDFQAKMSSMSLNEAIDGLSDQTYNIAKVVKKRFDQLSISGILFLISLGLLILFSILHQTIPKLY